MTQSAVFPIHLRPEYSAGIPAFDGLVRDAKQAADQMRRSFDSSFADFQKTVSGALSRPANAAGSLDLDVAGIERAAVEAQNYASALREVEGAARRAAAAQGDTTEETRLYLQAASAAAREAEEEARSLQLKARVHDLLQNELDQSTSATRRFIGTGGGVTGSLGAQRAAMIGVGQQLQDITVGFASGQRGATIFAQQLPQLGFALTGFEGASNKALSTLGRLGTFLAGPWGIAVFGATTALGFMVQSLLDTDETAKDAEKAAFDFSRGLDVTRLSADRASDAMKQLANETRALIAVQANVARNNQIIAQTSLAAFDAQIAQIDGRLTGLAQTAQPGLLDFLVPGRSSERARAEAEARRLRGERAKLGQGRDAANEALVNTQIALTQREVNGELDKGVRLQNDYNEAVADLIRLRQTPSSDPLKAISGLNEISQGEFDRRYRDLTLNFEREKKLIKDAEREAGRGRTEAARAQKAAEREAAKQASEAARELEELERQVQRLTERFNPAAQAAREYAEALGTINRAASAGLISGGDATALQLQLGLDEARRAREAAQKQSRDFYDQLGIDVEGDFRNAVDAAAARWGDGLRDGVAGARDEFERQFGAIDFLRLIGGGQSLGSILAGLADDPRVKTGARGGIGQLLFGYVSPQDQRIDPDKVPKGLVQGYQDAQRELARTLETLFRGVFSEGGDFARVLGGAIAGAQTGSATAGILAQVGIKSDATAGAIGGALGEALGGKLLGKLGSAAGPIGSIAGSIIGSVIGGALSGSKRGSAIIGGSGSSLDVIGYYGNSSSRKDQAGGLAGQVNDLVARIAEELGGSVNAGRGRVSIGIRDDSLRVDTQGRGYTKSSIAGVLDFGSDAQAAVEAAAYDLIRDGVLEGLRRGSLQLLQNAGDLEKGLSDALKFEGVFDELLRLKDPLAFAVGELDDEFANLKEVFEKASADAAEFAQLEELYGLKRAEVVDQVNAQLTGALQRLLDDLDIGDNGLSLRDRQANALARFNPLADAIGRGEKVDADKFAEAARVLLEIEREVNGSTQGYFDRFEQIRGLTQTAIERAGGAAGSGLFDRDGAAAVTSAVDAQTAAIVQALSGGAIVDRLDALIVNFERISRLGGSGGGNDIPLPDRLSISAL